MISRVFNQYEKVSPEKNSETWQHIIEVDEVFGQLTHKAKSFFFFKLICLFFFSSSMDAVQLSVPTQSNFILISEHLIF